LFEQDQFNNQPGTATVSLLQLLFSRFLHFIGTKAGGRFGREFFRRRVCLEEKKEKETGSCQRQY
jgi:hypothetical protein